MESLQSCLNTVMCNIGRLTDELVDAGRQARLINPGNWGRQVYRVRVFSDGSKFSISRFISRFSKSALDLGSRFRSLETFTESVRDPPPLTGLSILKSVDDIWFCPRPERGRRWTTCAVLNCLIHLQA